MDRPTPPRQSSFLTVIGLFLTLAYLLGAIALINHGDIKVTDLKANEIGDFLAGVFAPLAFLWLVLGFFLQGQELRHSSAALWLQGEELAKSVEHQRDLAEQTRRQVDAELRAAVRADEEAEARAQPLLAGTASNSYNGTSARVTIRIRNAGAICSNVRIYVDEELISSSSVFSQGDEITFVKRWDNWSYMSDVRGTIAYVDARGTMMGREFVAALLPHAGPNERHSMAGPTFNDQLFKNYLR